jgi:tetratricopeptide (TPR) repeat protein
MLSLLSSLAAVYQSEHRYPEAEATLERARALLEQVRPADPVSEINLLNNIGVFYRERRRYLEAEATYRKAQALLKTIPDEERLLIPTISNNLALVCIHQNNYAEAGALFSNAIDAIERGTLLPRREVGEIFENYRRFLKRSGRGAAAKDLESRAKVVLGAMPHEGSEAFLVDVSQLDHR